METPNPKPNTWVGEAVHTAGWFTFILSVWSGLCLKGSPKPGAIDFPVLGFFSTVTVLGLGSLVYCFGSRSKKWRPEMRSWFGPYLLGALGWIVLILFLHFLKELQ